MTIRTALLGLAFWTVCQLPLFAADHVVFVSWDGYRWQELFQGAQEGLMSKDVGGVPNEKELRDDFWRETPVERRERITPFFWKVLATQGQVFGDPDQGSLARITNGKKFSYPGYHEMLVGYADERITSNDKIPNPNITVFEHLNDQPQFAGRVAAFATWDVMEFILNRQRSGLPVLNGWTKIDDAPLTPGQRAVNEMVDNFPRLWRGNVFDTVTFHAAMEHLKKHEPKVLYIGLGETDEWAHAKRYDLYLEAARRSDDYLRQLWEQLQAMPAYRDQTTLIITTDHGRGFDRAWTNHSADTDGAEFIWMGAMGPGIPPLGVRKDTPATQSQIAATIAAAVGVDYRASFPKAAEPLEFTASK